MKQRPQHLAEELSKVYNITYIEPSLSLLNCILNPRLLKSKLYSKHQEKIHKQLTKIRPSGIFRLPKSFEFFDMLKINLISDKIQLRKLIEEADIIWLGSPIYWNIVNSSGKLIVFDKMDNYAELTNNILLKNKLYKDEDNLIIKADIVFASSKVLYDVCKENNQNTFLVRNAVQSNFVNLDVESKISKEIEALKNTKKIIFGYVGTIDYWFDFEAIKIILDKCINSIVILVGKNNIDIFKDERVIYMGMVNKEELPSIIKKFDFCLYTFKKIPMLDAINPVKIYEYLSLNKRVIAVKTEETNTMSKTVNLYNDYEELNEIVNNIHNINVPFSKEDQINNFITSNSWKGRATEISKIINFMFFK